MKFPPEYAAELVARASKVGASVQLPGLFRCEIPIPPTANHIWKTRVVTPRGKKPFATTYKSEEYAKWLGTAGFLMAQAKVPLRTPVVVKVIIYGGHGFTTQRDGDNVFKPIGDCLRHAGVISNDTVSHVRQWQMEYRPPVDERAVARCVVEVFELPSDQPELF